MKDARDGDLGRFAEPALLILDSLADGPKHGYLLMVDIESRTGRVLGAGTLYAALARLEARGHVRPLASTDRRRPYEITESGAGYLGAQLRELASFSTAGLRRLEARAR